MQQPSTILDHPIVSSHYFFPRHEAFPEPYWVEAADGSRLACAYHVVDPAAKTVIYFHGNGEIVADYLPDFPRWLGQAGYNVLLAEYRGYGMSTGQPALVGMFADVSAIIQRLGIAEQQVVLFGRSIGSLYAVHGGVQASAHCWTDSGKRYCQHYRAVFLCVSLQQSLGCHTPIS